MMVFWVFTQCGVMFLFLEVSEQTHYTTWLNLRIPFCEVILVMKT